MACSIPNAGDMSRPVTALSVRQYGASPGSHSHPHFQVILGLSGVLDLEIEGRGHGIGTGEGVVIGPDDRHDFESRQGAQCLVLDSDDLAWAALAHCSPDSGAIDLARYLAQACHDRRPRAWQLGPTLLLEAWTSSPHAPRTPRRGRPIDWHRLRSWAGAHLHTPLTTEDLATQVHLSAAQFTSRSLQELGVTPMAWLRSMRLDRARHWLAQGLSVGDTAHRCGYRSPSALTAAIRRETHVFKHGLRDD